MSLLKSGLLLRNYRTITRHFERHVQEFSRNKFDNTTPRDHVVILPEPLDESSNLLLKFNSNESGLIDFSAINAESAFKGLSQALVQYRNLLADVNNGSLTFNSFQELLDEVQAKTYSLDTAYNTVLMLCHLNSSKLNYVEIIDLIKKVSQVKNEKFWPNMKEAVQSFYDTDSKLSPQQLRLTDYYKIQSPCPVSMQAENLYSLESYRTFIKRDVTQIHQNLQMANHLFSHTVDDPDVLAGISDVFDDCVDQHHKRRTPLKITVDTYSKFMEVCPDRFIRHNLWKTLNKRCSPKAAPKYNNLSLITNVRSLRRSNANLIGYRNHLEFRLSNAIATSRQSILDKLNDINQQNRKQILDRLEELEAFADDNGFQDPHKLGIQDYDVDYWGNKYVQDIIIGKPRSEVKTHFTLPSVLRGLKNYFKSYMGVEIEENHNSFKTWNDKVEVYRFLRNGEMLGNVIYDPYQRHDKKIAKSAVGFIRGRNKDVGSSPVHFVSTSYKPEPLSGDALLSIRDIVNLFYSFGVVTQKLLYNYDIYELNSFGGLQHDAENLFPNLVILHLLEDHRILQSCSVREDSKCIDTDLTLRLLKAHTYFNCFRTWKELYKAHLDVETYSTMTDIRTLVSEIYPIYSPFPRDADNYDYCSMSEIFASPYDGRQYSSLWSEQLARFCLTKVLSDSGSEGLAQTDVGAIKASNESLIATLYDQNDFNTSRKLTSFIGCRFETTQASLGML